MAVLLGRTSAGTSGDFNGSGHAALWKFTATASGRLATIFAQTKVANATGTVTLAIYSDSAGVANVRLAKATVSGTGTGTGVFSADVSASAVDIVNGTVYWLGWRNSAETMDFQGDASGVYDESLGTVDFIDPWAAGSAGAVNAILWGESVDSPSSSPPSWQAPLSGIRLPGHPAVAPPIGPASGSERSAFDVISSLPISQFLHPLSLALGARLFPAAQPYVQPSASIVFNDSGSGTITLSGTGTESHSHSASPSGTITLSGTRTESQAHSRSGSGTVTLSGSGTDSASFSDSRSGTITLSGSGTESRSTADSGTGTITLSGSFTQSWSVSESRSGTITLSGSGVENFQPPGGSPTIDNKLLSDPNVSQHILTGVR